MALGDTDTALDSRDLLIPLSGLSVRCTSLNLGWGFFLFSSQAWDWREDRKVGGRERGREEGREGGREGGRDGGREGGRND